MNNSEVVAIAETDEIILAEAKALITKNTIMENVDEIMDVSKLKVSELRKELKARNLLTTGNKQELMERLQAAMKTSSTKSDLEAEDLDEALLNEDDDEHIEENDSVLSELDSQLDVSASSIKLKRKSTELEHSPKQAKKIVLNRSSSNCEDKPEPEAVETSPSVMKEHVDKGEEKKIVKLSQLTAKERLEMRAKKFGVPLSADAQKLARAERFGDKISSSTNGSSKNNRISASPTANVDVLKQRAQRFGVSVSKALTKLENDEKLQKRKARFATSSSSTTTVEPATTTSVEPKSSNDQEAKALQRLQRFNQTPA